MPAHNTTLDTAQAISLGKTTLPPSEITTLTERVQQVTVLNAAESFLRIAISGKAKQTQNWYRARCKLIWQYLGQERPLSDVLEIDLIKWREHLESKNLAPDTLHGYLRVTRRLFRWLWKRGLITGDITTELHLPTLPKRGRSGISDEDAHAILQAAKDHSPRDYALLLFFASTNARRGGAVGLKTSDLKLQAQPPINRQVRVVEKGSKERTVVMDHQTQEAITAWLEIRPPGSDYVFVTDDGQPLAADSINEIIRRYKDKLKIKGKCSPHQWRHRWFRCMISNGMPLAQAAQLGGHENVEITYRFYSQFAFDELQNAYDKYHKPL